MRVALIVNDVDLLRPSQTTTLLASAGLERKHEIIITGVTNLSLTEHEEVIARGVVLNGHGKIAPPRIISKLEAASWGRVRLDECDMVLIRTSPGRDLARAWAHRFTLSITRLLAAQGVLVVNDPIGLERASSKLYLIHLPAELRPPGIISNDPAEIADFVRRWNRPVVLKPLVGSQGRDVFFVHESSNPNLDQIAEVLARSGYIVAQDYLPEAVSGDVRIIVMDGEPLVAGGRYAAVARRPAAGALRSNVHLGGVAAPFEPSDEMLDIARRIGQFLQDDGIYLAGLDFIGMKVVEVNVFSTGGLLDAERLYERPFARLLWEKFEARALRRTPKPTDRE